VICCLTVGFEYTYISIPHTILMMAYCVLDCSNIIYYIDKSVLVGNKPLVKFIRNYIRNSSGVFPISSLVRISMTSFPTFTLLFVQAYFCLYNKKKITRWLEDMNFIFLWQKTIFYSLAALVRKILRLQLENKIHIFAPPCNILYLICSANLIGYLLSFLVS